jgi:thiamine biosynthesis protein ThiS
MKIILNNREEIFEKESVTVTDMLILKNYSFKLRVVKINGKFISKDSYNKTFLKDGDNVQMLYLMSGG